MARKGNSRILTMFVEANWVTAPKVGATAEMGPDLRLASAGKTHEENAAFESSECV
jgi:hypothetical protein